MHYLTISFTHKNSTLEIREKLSYPDNESMRGCLTKLNSSYYINESILISTCNRMEVFCSCKDLSGATKHIFEMLNKRSNISLEELEGRADIFEDHGAIHHLFRVASSLDSMVIGETQIAGQLKDAFRFSFDNGFCGQKLSRAMHHAFKCAAKVRNSTDISTKPVSIASVAVSQIKSLFDDLKGKRALIIGVGEMSEISAKHLASSGVEVYIMNRTRAKAEALAQLCNAKVLDFSELSHAVNEFEILFSATASHKPIITDEIIETCDFNRYWFDLALPRDIHYSKGDRIHLYVIDDLKSIVNENLSMREEDAKESYAIIGRATMDFFEWLKTLDVEPLIKELYTKAAIAAKEETQRVVENGYIPKEYEEQLQKMSEQVLKRYLHDFTKRIRSVSEESKADMIIETLQFLVGNEKGELPNKYKCEHMLKG
ncbi:MAG: glutamyl-tRNA reductase [Epsilonproteobacteria bacterium]|nr:glutamyl-tRNA reductase [Campylobacterota bacterium]